MPTVYKNTRGQHAVRQWCVDAMARAAFPLLTATVDTSAGRISLTSAGTGRTRVVLVPGTGFNAAVTLPWLEALSLRWPTAVVDLPGQPGLSDPHRPRRARLTWYGRILAEVLEAIDAERVVLVGNSLGAAVALAADSSRIAGRALVSPAGFMRLSLDPKLAVASSLWLLQPTAEHTRRLLRMFVAGAMLPTVLWIDGATRPGYSLWHHGASQVGLGERAGLQTVNFVLGGMLVVGFAIGVRRVLQSGRGANWGPTLLAAAGIGLEPA
jgi:pimeloyl-ACP methyl ester carboxylesterase